MKIKTGYAISLALLGAWNAQTSALAQSYSHIPAFGSNDPITNGFHSSPGYTVTVTQRIENVSGVLRSIFNTRATAELIMRGAPRQDILLPWPPYRRYTWQRSASQVRENKSWQMSQYVMYGAPWNRVDNFSLYVEFKGRSLNLANSFVNSLSFAGAIGSIVASSDHRITLAALASGSSEVVHTEGNLGYCMWGTIASASYPRARVQTTANGSLPPYQSNSAQFGNAVPGFSGNTSLENEYNSSKIIVNLNNTGNPQPSARSAEQWSPGPGSPAWVWGWSIDYSGSGVSYMDDYSNSIILAFIEHRTYISNAASTAFSYNPTTYPHAIPNVVPEAYVLTSAEIESSVRLYGFPGAN